MARTSVIRVTVNPTGHQNHSSAAEHSRREGSYRSASIARTVSLAQTATTAHTEDATHHSTAKSTTVPPHGAGTSKHTSVAIAQQAKADERKAKATVAPPCARVPLWVMLLLQCVLIVGVFVVLVVTVSVQMQATTEALVTDRITSDMLYSRASIANPVENAEQLTRGHRLRYMAESEAAGHSLCGENHSFDASTEFIRDALSTVVSHAPGVGWLYAVHASPAHVHGATGDREVYECAVSTAYTYTRAWGQTRTSDVPLTLENVNRGYAEVTSTVDAATDHRYDEYVVLALSVRSFTWNPYLWIDVTNGASTLLIGGYLPMYVNRTLPDGTVVTQAASIDDPSRDAVNTTVIATLCIDVSLAHVGALVRSITPQTEGAHTALYDLNGHYLLATSDGSLPMTDEASGTMWRAGHTPSSALNDAFYAASPSSTTAVDTTRGAVAIQQISGHVLSAVYIATSSNIHFVLIQSTPASYYYSDVVMLRTLMIALGVCSAFAVVAVCVAIVIMIRRSLREIQAGMVLAAVLKNDRVVPMRSVMTEIDDLCLAFGAMNAKLGDARAFMPQSMLAGNTDSDNAYTEDDDEGDSLGLSLSREGKLALEDSKLGVSVTTDASTAKHTNCALERSSGKGWAKVHIAPKSVVAPVGGGSSDTGAVHGLQVKRVTILAINTRGFNSSSRDGVAVSSIAAELSQTIQSLCSQHRGVIDSFHGDHYILAFNAAKHNAQGPLKAVQCATAIRDVFANQHGGTPTAFSMGVSAGRSLVGHLGSSDMKRFSIVGRAYSRALALERVCKLVADEVLPSVKGGAKAQLLAMPHTNPRTSLLTDASIVRDIEHFYALQVMGKLCESAAHRRYALAASAQNNTNANLAESSMHASSGPAPRALAALSSSPMQSLLSVPPSGPPPHPIAASRAVADMSPFEFVGYAVVGTVGVLGSAGGGAGFGRGCDEWLYEVARHSSAGGGGGTAGVGGVGQLLAAVNSAMLGLLEHMHSPLMMPCAVGVDDAEAAIAAFRASLLELLAAADSRQHSPATDHAAEHSTDDDLGYAALLRAASVAGVAPSSASLPTWQLPAPPCPASASGGAPPLMALLSSVLFLV